jgi:uncharacterized membrane protein YccC
VGRTVSFWDLVHALSMAIACLITYWIMTQGLGRLVDRESGTLGGMWAAIATVFVWRETAHDALSAGLARLIATCVSFALCLPYLWLFPSGALGMALLLSAGTIVMALLNRREDIITTAITTIVVMVVAAINPHDAWHQPLLRLLDTTVGIGVGVACKWLSSAPLRNSREACDSLALHDGDAVDHHPVQHGRAWQTAAGGAIGRRYRRPTVPPRRWRRA